MGISPEVEAQYENNRLRMMQVNRGFRRFMWFSIILGALIFSTSFLNFSKPELRTARAINMIF